MHTENEEYWTGWTWAWPSEELGPHSAFGDASVVSRFQGFIELLAPGGQHCIRFIAQGKMYCERISILSKEKKWEIKIDVKCREHVMCCSGLCAQLHVLMTWPESGLAGSAGNFRTRRSHAVGSRYGWKRMQLIFALYGNSIRIDYCLRTDVLRS